MTSEPTRVDICAAELLRCTRRLLKLRNQLAKAEDELLWAATEYDNAWEEAHGDRLIG